MGIERARPEDEAAIRQLIESAGLPTADIAAASLAHFLVLRDDGALAGVVGLDPAGDVSMLRSLAVAPEARGKGYGRLLVSAAEAAARGLGIRRLYLLTTTADRYFAARGYEVVGREAAPEAVRAMPQFKSLCPASSVFMTRVP